ncbi:MAG: ferrous iron transport protein A [Acidobacteria bacterium]|nr:ferrous iron transport protein A [Acidobacteriota bacterium]
MPAVSQSSLADLKPGVQGLIERLDLPEPDARRLMELGFLPGSHVQLSRRSPFGDPSVFRIDDAEIALRRETAVHILLRSES